MDRYDIACTLPTTTSYASHDMCVTSRQWRKLLQHQPHIHDASHNFVRMTNYIVVALAATRCVEPTMTIAASATVEDAGTTSTRQYFIFAPG